MNANDIYYAMRVKDYTFGAADRLASINPADPVHEIIEPGEDTFLVVERVHWYTKKKSLRVLCGSGGKYEVEVGQWIGWVNDTGLGHRHDYTHHYQVVGINDTVNGVREGLIPNKKLPFFVMK